MTCDLVRIENEAGLWLDGLVYEPDTVNGVVVHIHGSFGNFYSNPFITEMARHYGRAGFAFMTFNLTTHDGVAEGYFSDGRFAYIGGAVASFESCCNDIAALVKYSRRLSSRVILQGHSLGCDRIVHYCLAREEYPEIILLSPCDSYVLQERWLTDETVNEQILRLSALDRNPNNLYWVADAEYGIRGGGSWTYNIPITLSALMSILTGPPMHVFRVSTGAAAFCIPTAAFVWFGGKDGLQTATDIATDRFFTSMFDDTSIVRTFGADHSLHPVERSVAESIVRWLTRESA
jgi:hypothetical protein